MGKPEILEILRIEKPGLMEKYGLEELALFGSYARGEETSESDIDILVKLKTADYSCLISIMTYLESKFRKKIDLVRKGPHLTERFFRIVGNDIIYV